MRTVVISVNNEVIDFFPRQEFDIAPLVFKRLFNAQNLEQVSGNFTLNFKLPLTEKNRTTFSFIDQNDEVKSFGDLQILKCSIVADSDLIIKGTLTIKAITDKAYDVTLIGDNIDWASEFKSKSIRDIQSFRKPLWSGNRSTSYSPWPLNFPNTVGYGELFDVTVDPLGQRESGDYDFATPLISYGNFTFPRIQGYIDQNFGIYFLAVATLDTNFMPTVFPATVYYNGLSITLTNQISGATGAAGAYQIDISAGIPALYGSSTDLKDFFLIDNSLYQFSGNTGGYWFYNNQDWPLTWRDLKPAPYLVTTVKRMFQDLQYNVGGDFFSNPKFQNIIIPFVSKVSVPYIDITGIERTEEIEPWNWQIMGRLNTQFTQQNNGQPQTYNWIRFNNGENSGAVQQTGGKRIQFIRPNGTNFNSFTAAGNLQNSYTPTSVTINENYSYSETFNNFDRQFVNQEQFFQSYQVQATGYYNLIYILRQFGAKESTVLGQNNWNIGGEKIFYLFTKRTNNTFNGSLGQGLIFWDGSNYITDPDVVFVSADNITGNPFYNNMKVTPQNKTINGTVYLEAGDVIEFIIAIAGPGNASYTPGSPLALDDRITIAIGNQQLTIEKGSISDFIVTPLSFSTELNPADWLPDINQADFLKSIINSYNLFVSYDDQNNRIDINEYENNFLPLGTSQDFTEKTTIDSNVKKEPLDKFKQVLFNEVIDDQDILQLSAVPSETYTNNLTGFNQIKNIDVLWTETAIKNYNHINFNNTLVYPDTINSISQSQIPIPTLSTEQTALTPVYELSTQYTYDIGFNIRLLKYEGIVRYYANNDGMWVETTPYFSLATLATKLIPQATTLSSLTYVKNWKKWLSLIENNILYTIEAKLLTSDIAQIDLRKPIQIGNRSFIINSIERFNVLEDTPTIIKCFKKK